MSMENAVKKKYRMSLLYLLKDLLKSMLIGGIICPVVIVLLLIFVEQTPFDITVYLKNIIESFVVGVVGGILYRCIAGGNIGEDAGVALFNVYAGIHNTFLFSGAGYSYNAAFAVIGIIFTILRFVYKIGCTVVVFPISFVYLCIMAILETIFNGLPESLGNVLDKLIPILAKICGIVAIFLVLKSWN